MSSQDARSNSFKNLSNMESGSQVPPQPPFNPLLVAPPFPPPPPPALAHHPQAQQAYLNHLAVWQQWAQTQQFLPAPSNARPLPMLPPPAPPMYPFGALPLRPGNGGFNVQAQYGYHMRNKSRIFPVNNKARPFKPGGNNAHASPAQPKSRKSNVEYEPLPHKRESRSFRIDKTSRKSSRSTKVPNAPAPDPKTVNTFDPATTANPNAPIATPKNEEEGRKKKQGEAKIMVPAPKPRPEYLAQAKCEPHVVTPSDQKLVILDLNGTLLYRPNRKQPTKMIGRPFLDEFLKYLFSNFAVMVWSSAKPQNVKVLVENGLGDFQQQLLGRWARNSFGLSEKLYNRNVQVYKNLELVWASSDIQGKMEGYEQGKRFNQSNTILIDDSSLKAAAQPFNLIEIPEFFGQPTQQDILCEVAGYLEILKVQEDVSKFIFQTKFKADGTWASEWHDLLPAESIPESKAESSALTPTVIGE